jgi:hypothetical protein
LLLCLHLIFEHLIDIRAYHLKLELTDGHLLTLNVLLLLLLGISRAQKGVHCDFESLVKNLSDDSLLQVARSLQTWICIYFD